MGSTRLRILVVLGVVIGAVFFAAAVETAAGSDVVIRAIDA